MERPRIRMLHRLGLERGVLGMDPEWLVLRLDERPRVAEHRVVTD